MRQGKFLKINRRFFLGQSVVSALAFLWLGSIQSCSTLDEYLIEDQFDFDQDVIIVGGGISGLFAAYELKKNKIPFKLFDSNSRFGGQIQTLDQVEWGAYQFKKTDHFLIKLAEELNLEIEYHNKTNWSFKKGASILVAELLDLIQGIMPQRQLKQGYKLTSIRKIGYRYQLVFNNNERDRIYFAKKVVLALPSAALRQIKGLDSLNADVQSIYHVLQDSKYLTALRVYFPIDRIRSAYKIQNRKSMIEKISLQHAQQLNKTDTVKIMYDELNGLSYLTVYCVEEHPIRYFENIQNLIGNLVDDKFVLTTDHVKDWGPLIFKGSESQNLGFGFEIKADQVLKALPSSSFLQIISDGFIAEDSEKSQIEQLLRMVRAQMSAFKADI